MNRTSIQRKLPARPQQGFVLALCLVLLLVMTILGVTALNTTVSEEGMARDIQESINAFQNAETGSALAISYLRRNKTVETDFVNDANSGPAQTKGLPQSHQFGLIEKEKELHDGDSTEYTLRKVGSVDGPAKGCVAVGKEQSGGCSVFYEYRATGYQRTANASVYSGGCIYTPLESDTLLNGSFCQ